MAASGLARSFYRALYPGINESSPFRSWSAEGQLPEVCSGDPPSRFLDVFPRARVTTTECLSIADALLPRVRPGLVSCCLHEPLMEPGLTTIFRCARSSLPMLIVRVRSEPSLRAILTEVVPNPYNSGGHPRMGGTDGYPACHQTSRHPCLSSHSPLFSLQLYY